MTSEELRELLLLQEGLKLDFKREFQLDKKAIPEGVQRQDWVKYVNGRWDELTKDIIALTNGNVGVANETAHLVIGAGDQKVNGARPLFDTRNLRLTDQQILSAVNNKCTPPIASLNFEQLDLDGKVISVISIPPSRYLHECSSDLEVTKGKVNSSGKLNLDKTKTYTKYTAFIRNNDGTFPASNFERRKLEEDKRFHLLAVDEGIKFELIQNMRSLLTKDGASGRVFDPTEAWHRYKSKYTFDLRQDFQMDKIEAGVCLLLLMQTSSAVSKMQTQFLDEAIISKHYLHFDSQIGQYVTGRFLETLISLQRQIRQLVSISSDISSLIGRWMQGMSGQKLQVSASDALMVGGILNIYTNVINLHIVVLRFLDGSIANIPSIEILTAAVNENMRVAVEKESVTDDDVLAWLSNLR